MMRISRLVLLLFLAAALQPILLSPALPCGVLTHGEITQRGAWFFADDDFPQYQDWLVDYRGALLAGAGFPDWGWIVGRYDEAEAAHARSMTNAAADYMHSTYPKPWDEETKKSAVFMLGFLSHIIADTQYTTHRSKQYEEGFLGVMHQIEFPDSFNVAHRLGDYGGDVFVAYQYPVDYLESWYVPSTDMAALYNEMGYTTVTPQLLENTMQVMYLATLAERAAMEIFSGAFGMLTTFLPENLQDFFAGGLDDMAVQCAWQWPDLVDRIENGVKSEPVAEELVQRENGREILFWHGIAQKMIEDGELVLHKQPTVRGITFSATLTKTAHKTIAEVTRPQGQDRSLNFELSTPYSYLGTSLATGDFNADGIDDLAMGAPGFGGPGEAQIGAVHILYHYPEITEHQSRDLEADSPDLTIKGATKQGRLGWSLAVLDFNADGIDDLALSSPTQGDSSGDYFGAVRIHFGSPNGLHSSADVIIKGQEHRQNFGWMLTASDIDEDGFDDLIVGSPFAPADGYQRGEVAIFLSNSDHIGPVVLNADQADHVLSGENDYDWFGYAMAFGAFVSGDPILFVGAPNRDVAGSSGNGAIYGYNAGDLNGPRLFTISGSARFEKVGASMAVLSPFGDGKPYLAIARPTGSTGDSRQAGLVDLIDPGNLAGDIDLEELIWAAAFEGDLPYGRFGMTLGVTDANADGIDDLWIAAPFAKTEIGNDAGGAYLYLGGDGFATNATPKGPQDADWFVESPKEQSRLGCAVAFADINADGYPDGIFGSRQHSADTQNAGRATALPWPAPVLFSADPATATVGATVQLTLQGEYLFDKETQLRLSNQANENLNPDQIDFVDENTITMTLTLPADLAPGAVSISFESRFGISQLDDGFEIINESSDDDDDMIDDDGSTDDDDSDDAPLTGEDSDSSDDDEGCCG